MRKIFICMLVVLLFIMADSPAAHAADTNPASLSIPITTGLITSDGSAKTFLLELPSGVSSTSVKSSSLKYVGSNETIGNIMLESGKIKVTLKGVSNQKNILVNGFQSGNNRLFTTNIGNSIWRYSDGRRWQINDYNSTKGRIESSDKGAQDSFMPSKRVPLTLVNAMSNQSTTGRGWYNDTGEKIDEQYVLTSTIEVIKKKADSYVKEVKFPNGKIVTSYYIPNDPEDLNWVDQTALATIPITQHVQGRFYSAIVEYYYTATAQVTTYSYGGTISFDYAVPTEPTLTGSAVVLKPNPNPTKFESKDVPVQLSLKGELAAYSDSSNIEEWIFYAKEKGVDSTLQTKKDYKKVLNSNAEFNFTIPKTRITSDDFEQQYDLTVVVRFTKPVVTSSGSITSLQESYTATVEVMKNPTLPIEPPAGPTLIPPVAVLDIPDTVMAGEEFMASGGGSYDPDGTIVEYKWTTPAAVEKVTGSYGWTWYPIDQLGYQRVSLRVIDNDDLGKSTSGKIEVINPVPTAALEISGSKKENRKMTITNKSRSPEHYPIDETKTQFILFAVSGGTNTDIKYSGTLSGFNVKDVLFKKAGTYKATITVTNTAGFSDSTSMTFDIVPDEPPVVYISVPSVAYRNPESGNQASVSMDDLSFSPDYDWLDHRLWEYRYDSNNDGNFEGEVWVIFSNENKPRLNLPLAQVGKYEVRLTVTEEFDQPTIDEFVTRADRRSADSGSQSSIEKIVDVKNRPPVVDWTW